MSESSAILSHLNNLLHSRAPPKTICPSEVARALSSSELRELGVDNWRDLMPDIRAVVWKLRDDGKVEILQKGVVLGADVQIADVKGPIRVRKTTKE